MSVFDDLFGDFHILFKRVLGAIIHDRGEAAIDAGFADFKRRTMVQVQGGGDFRIVLEGNFYKSYNIFLTGVVAGAFRSLENHRRFFFLSSFHDALDDFHVVHIECTNGIVTFVRFFKHFRSSYERHNDTFLSAHGLNSIHNIKAFLEIKAIYLSFLIILNGSLYFHRYFKNYFQ